jgi:hypothetical protein
MAFNFYIWFMKDVFFIVAMLLFWYAFSFYNMLFFADTSAFPAGGGSKVIFLVGGCLSLSILILVYPWKNNFFNRNK